MYIQPFYPNPFYPDNTYPYWNDYYNDYYYDYRRYVPRRYNWITIETHITDNRSEEDKLVDKMEQSEVPEVKKLAKQLKRKLLKKMIAELEKPEEKPEKKYDKVTKAERKQI